MWRVTKIEYNLTYLLNLKIEKNPRQNLHNYGDVKRPKMFENDQC